MDRLGSARAQARGYAHRQVGSDTFTFWCSQLKYLELAWSLRFRQKAHSVFPRTMNTYISRRPRTCPLLCLILQYKAGGLVHTNLKRYSSDHMYFTLQYKDRLTSVHKRKKVVADDGNTAIVGVGHSNTSVLFFKVKDTQVNVHKEATGQYTVTTGMNRRITSESTADTG